MQKAVVATSAATGIAAIARGTFVAALDLVAAAPLRESVDANSGNDRAAGAGADGEGLVMCRQNAGFDVLQLAFDGVMGCRLAVAGLRTVQARQALIKPQSFSLDQLWYSPTAILSTGCGWHHLDCLLHSADMKP